MNKEILDRFSPKVQERVKRIELRLEQLDTEKKLIDLQLKQLEEMPTL